MPSTDIKFITTLNESRHFTNVAFAGPIGKALSTCQLMPVVAFEGIVADLPSVDLKNLSTDQKYMWEITNAVSSGECSLALAQRQPGTLNHSRW